MWTDDQARLCRSARTAADATSDLASDGALSNGSHVVSAHLGLSSRGEALDVSVCSGGASVSACHGGVALSLYSIPSTFERQRQAHCSVR